MNPKPFSSLNHLTVPVDISRGNLPVGANRCAGVSPRSAQKPEDRRLDPLAIGELIRRRAVQLAVERAADGVAGVEAVDHAGIDVGTATDRRRVGEVARDLLDRLVDRATPGGPAELPRVVPGEGDCSEDGRV